MSDELVNQLTLNFLISKNQLQKLNRKMKETTDTNRKSDREIYGSRVKELFDNLLVNNTPDNLLQEVQTGFDFFIDKCIYYFKALDNNELLEKERSTDNNSNDIIHDDIDYEKEERAIERGDYQENSEENDEQEEDEEDDEEDEEDDEEDEEDDEEEEPTNKNIVHQSVTVKHKYNKKTNSVGVDDIQKLPLDWFQNVRQSYKKNQIIPRKKEIII